MDITLPVKPLILITNVNQLLITKTLIISQIQFQKLLQLKTHTNLLFNQLLNQELMDQILIMKNSGMLIGTEEPGTKMDLLNILEPLHTVILHQTYPPTKKCNKLSIKLVTKNQFKISHHLPQLELSLLDHLSCLILLINLKESSICQMLKETLKIQV